MAPRFKIRGSGSGNGLWEAGIFCYIIFEHFVIYHQITLCYIWGFGVQGCGVECYVGFRECSVGGTAEIVGEPVSEQSETAKAASQEV